jgi:hypothetical protein
MERRFEKLGANIAKASTCFECTVPPVENAAREFAEGTMDHETVFAMMKEAVLIL